MQSTFRVTVFSIGIVILFVASVVLVHHGFTSRFTGANDFFPRWRAASLYLEKGISPYSEEATATIQRGMYGRLARPDEDQVAFAYPFYTIFLLAPLVVLNLSYPLVSATWLVFLFLTISVSLIVSMKMLAWEIPIWLVIVLLIWGILFYNSTRTLILGQFAGFVFVMMVLCLFALCKHNDLAAGVLLAATTVKPQMSVLLILALLIWGATQHRKRFLISFFITLGLLVIASVLLLPSWIQDFLRQVAQYSDYTGIGSPVWIITRYYWPQLGHWSEIIITILLSLILIYKGFRLIRDDKYDRSLLPLTMYTLVVSNLIMPRTATTNQIVLFLPIFWALARGVRYELIAYGHIALFCLVTFVAGWTLFLNTHAGTGEKPVMYLYLPALALLAIIFDAIVTSRDAYRQELSSDALPG